MARCQTRNLGVRGVNDTVMNYTQQVNRRLLPSDLIPDAAAHTTWLPQGPEKKLIATRE